MGKPMLGAFFMSHKRWKSPLLTVDYRYISASVIVAGHMCTYNKWIILHLLAKAIGCLGQESSHCPLGLQVPISLSHGSIILSHNWVHI